MARPDPGSRTLRRMLFRCATPLFMVVVLADAVFLATVLAGSLGIATIVLHLLATTAGAALLPWCLRVARPGRRRQLALLVFAVSLLVPVGGLAGSLLAMKYAIRRGNQLPSDFKHWTFTPVAALPFTSPDAREAALQDRRGVVEQLRFHPDSSVLHRKVLATANIDDALAVTPLKLALQHEDERVRLTAYKTLDRKITRLNQEIQRLERSLEQGWSGNESQLYLDMASNYWELLTLEKDEPVARQQLLSKASEAAIRSVAANALNRNAHYTLGRISLMQGDTRRARVALERAMALGLSAGKILPYLAEADFMDRDFHTLRKRLAALDKSFGQYPPLSHLVAYWA